MRMLSVQTVQKGFIMITIQQPVKNVKYKDARYVTRVESAANVILDIGCQVTLVPGAMIHAVVAEGVLTATA